jgi:hypothetical protein
MWPRSAAAVSSARTSVQAVRRLRGSATAAPPCLDLAPGGPDPPPSSSPPAVVSRPCPPGGPAPPLLSGFVTPPAKNPRQAVLLRRSCPDSLPRPLGTPAPPSYPPPLPESVADSPTGWFLLGYVVQNALGRPPEPSAAVQSSARLSDCLCFCPGCVLHLHPRRIWLYLHLPWVSGSGLGQNIRSSLQFLLVIPLLLSLLCDFTNPACCYRCCVISPIQHHVSQCYCG